MTNHYEGIKQTIGIEAALADSSDEDCEEYIRMKNEQREQLKKKYKSMHLN